MVPTHSLTIPGIGKAKGITQGSGVIIMDEEDEVGVGANPAQCPLCSGLQALGQTFGANPAFASSLRYLDLSKNPGLLATDEANVSPWNTASNTYKSMFGIPVGGQGAILPWSLGAGRGFPTFLCLYYFFLRPSIVSWPNPTPWYTWTFQGRTVPSTW